MATPNSKDSLKEYCLRALGKPVIEINVDDDQVDDRLDEALQYFAEFHMDGVERLYLKHQITAAEKTRAVTNTTESITDAVDNSKLADQAVTLDKLPHGTSSNNGKFLRANNGADPSFETIDLTTLSASNLTSGTIPDARFPSTLPAIDGSALTGVSSQKADGCVTENSQTISNNYTMGTNKSGISAGPITIANNVTVNIPSGSRYVIV